METVITKSNQSGIVIKPIKHDEFKRYYKNPHRRPNGLKGWRLDSNANADVNSFRDVKILFKKMSDEDFIEKYNVIYFTIPDRFDLESDVIPKTLHTNLFLTEKVINRACELATRDYKANTLESQIQTNNRSK